jgi:hypothetical protein
MERHRKGGCNGSRRSYQEMPAREDLAAWTHAGIFNGAAGFRNILQSLVEVFCKALPNQASDLDRRGPGKSVLFRLPLQNRGDDIGCGLSGQRVFCRQQFEQDAAKGPDVRARIDFPAASLFRAHVAGSTEDSSHLGFETCGYLGGCRRRSHSLGQSKIENLDSSFRRQFDVRRLDVAVCYALSMRCFDRIRHLAYDVQSFPYRHRPRSFRRWVDPEFDFIRRLARVEDPLDRALQEAGLQNSAG